MQRSRIQWTELTWNPTRGCTRVSRGCENCYAERIAGRFMNGAFKGYVKKVGDRVRWTGRVALHRHKLGEPLAFNSSHRIFVNSMSDLFHPDLTNEEIGLVWVVMASCLPQFKTFLHRRNPGQHQFQILTKRPQRMEAWTREIWPSRKWRRTLIPWVQNNIPGHQTTPVEFLDALPDVLPNVHLGTSIEDQVTAAERVPMLLRCPAAFRFVSYEPALEEVDLSVWLFDRAGVVEELIVGPARLDREYAEASVAPTLDLVIAGGESGRSARPAEVEWFYQVADQARDAKVEFQLKQLGTVLARESAASRTRIEAAKTETKFLQAQRIQWFGAESRQRAEKRNPGDHSGRLHERRRLGPETFSGRPKRFLERLKGG